MEDTPKNMKVVWTIVERTGAGGVTKSFWTRVGVAFVNRDGSLTVNLDAIPISGKLQVREAEPYDRRVGDSAEGPMRARPRPQTAATGDSLI
jgi:hypothetical protein